MEERADFGDLEAFTPESEGQRPPELAAGAPEIRHHLGQGRQEVR